MLRWTRPLTVFAVFFFAANAGATYSIVATDLATDQVGGAGTSCVGSFAVSAIYGSVPNVGAVHAQALLSSVGRDEAVRLMSLDTAPLDIIAQITDPGFDAQAQSRQYGIVDLGGRSAGFTGTQNGAHAEDRQGTDASYTYSVQGNILTSAAVIDQAQAGFVGGGCDLADKLILALEAGYQGGEGDSRCTANNIPSDSGFIRVQRSDGSDLLFLEVTNTAPQNPVVLLKQMVQTWRAQNPCPMPAPADGCDCSVGASRRNANSGIFWVCLALATLWRSGRTRKRSV